MTTILTIVGFFAITFGLAGTISRWIRESEERKRTLDNHNAAVMKALERIEAAIAKSNTAAK